MRVNTVELVRDHSVRVRFSDGEERVVDLGAFLVGPDYAPLHADEALFRSLRVDEESGAIVWANGLDLDTDLLYWNLAPVAWDP